MNKSLENRIALLEKQMAEVIRYLNGDTRIAPDDSGIGGPKDYGLPVPQDSTDSYHGGMGGPRDYD